MPGGGSLRDWTRIVLIMARRTVAAPLVWVAGIAGCWIYLYTADAFWIARPTDLTLNCLLFVCVVVAPVMAAGAAWDHVRPGGRLAEDGAVRGVGSVVVARAAAAMLLTAIVFLVAVGAGTVRNGLSVHVWAAPSPHVIVLALALAALEISIVLAIATLVRRAWAVPVGLVAVFALLVWATRSEMSTGLRRYFPVPAEHWDPWSQPSWPAVAMTSAWCVAAGLGLLIAAAALRARDRRTTRSSAAVRSVLVLILVVSGVTVGSLSDESSDSLLAVERDAADSSSCGMTDAGSRVCLWDVDAFQRPTVLEGVGLLDAGVRGTGLPAPEFAEAGLEDLFPTAAPFFFASPPSSAQEVARALVAEYVPAPDSERPRHLVDSTIPGTRLDFVVSDVILARAGLRPAASGPEHAAAVEAILAKPPEGQQAWLADGFGALPDCRPMGGGVSEP